MTISIPEPFDIEATLEALGVNDKIALLAGSDFWHTVPLPAHDIPAVRMSDGPNGVRGISFFNGTPSTCFPCSTGLGSAFDVELAKGIGEALAGECRHKGAHILLAPTVNTQRSPLGGRGFESFSEDPHLNGTIAAAYIQGVQEHGVAATIKHYVGNDAEFERMSMDSQIGERALREIYLKPFQIALKTGKPWALMTAYNRVNGVHVSEGKRLLQDVLMKEWGFDGLIMSDWTGTYSTVEAIEAGLDLEMPGPSTMRGPALQRALTAQKLTVEDLDVRVRNVLKIVQRAQQSGIPFDKPEEAVDTPELRDLVRRAAADAIVLLKNDASVLPLTAGKKLIKKIAVLGDNSKAACISGGGSAALRPSWTVSPLEAITVAAKAELGAEVSWAVGAPGHSYQPSIDPYIAGGRIVFYNAPWEGKQDTEAIHSTESGTSFNMFLDNIPAAVNMTCWIHWSATFTPDQDGDWRFGFVVAGQGNIYVDGKEVVNNSEDQEQGELFFGLGSTEKTGTIALKAGQTYNLEARMSNQRPISKSAPFTARGAMRIGASKVISDEDAIKEAVELASKSDIAIIVVGMNPDLESEGFDRKHIDLPGATNELIERVLAVNEQTIVVNNSGMPVAMPWIDRAPTVVQAFFGGNESGSGLADVLFGKRDPSGKLPISFPRRLTDSPSFTSFPGENGKLPYNEGIFVGYRHPAFATAFAFGHGLTYTTFKYSDLSLPSIIKANGALSVSVKVTNTGSRPGREVVQLYVSDPVASLQRPEHELKAFSKTTVLAPGKSETVKLVLDRDAFSFYDDKRQAWVAERGVFGIRIAASSSDIRLTGETTLEQTFTWTGL